MPPIVPFSAGDERRGIGGGEPVPRGWSDSRQRAGSCFMHSTSFVIANAFHPGARVEGQPGKGRTRTCSYCEIESRLWQRLRRRYPGHRQRRHRPSSPCGILRGVVQRDSCGDDSEVTSRKRIGSPDTKATAASRTTAMASSRRSELGSTGPGKLVSGPGLSSSSYSLWRRHRVS